MDALRAGQAKHSSFLTDGDRLRLYASLVVRPKSLLCTRLKSQTGWLLSQLPYSISSECLLGPESISTEAKYKMWLRFNICLMLQTRYEFLNYIKIHLLSII